MGLLVATGALVLTNVDPDDELWLVGVCACTGALVLTNDPVVPDPPELVPFPVVLTGALVLINGDRDDPVPDVLLDPDVGVCASTGALVLTNVAVPPDPSEPLPLFAAGADVDAVALVPWAVGVAEPLSVPTLLRAAGDAGTPFRHAPAKAGDVEDTMDIPAPASPRRDAATAIARARLMKLLFISSTPLDGYSRSVGCWSAAWSRCMRNRNG